MKPPYRVPTMAEIAAIPSRGLTVMSLFAGCGGSSLGYRINGFSVIWANEFVEAARDVYFENSSGKTLVDGRDIRKIKPDAVMTKLGIAPGELDVLDGSPPCASFSTSGKREAGWGKTRKYSDRAQRTDDLFHEYVRFLGVLQPKVFVAENVYGLIKGRAQGTFIEIFEAMQKCGYRVESKLLDAQWLGVPQARQRLFFIGVREDLGVAPPFPAPLPYRYGVSDAIETPLLGIGGNGLYGKARWNPASWPARTIGAGPTTGNGRSPAGDVLVEVDGKQVRRKFTIPELKRVTGFPDDFVLTGSFNEQWERLGRAVPPVMMAAIARELVPVLAKKNRRPVARTAAAGRRRSLATLQRS